MKAERIGLILVIAISSFAISSCNNAEENEHIDAALEQYENRYSDDVEVDHYTCSMHPQIEKEKAGECSICGMDLVPYPGY